MVPVTVLGVGAALFRREPGDTVLAGGTRAVRSGEPPPGGSPTPGRSSLPTGYLSACGCV